ncbi:MAG: phytanoyl-CoA dioxygenase family protein [Burkholderiales bacterium]
MDLSEYPIFEDVSDAVRDFFDQAGYCHLRSKDRDYARRIGEAYEYYSSSQLDRNAAFRNAAGIPRHVVDVFRDDRSPAYEIYKSRPIAGLIDRLYAGNAGLVYTHAKLSFKVPGAAADWFPHQDSGYKSASDARKGFAIFVCLEDMNEGNGCLQLFPGSHKLGRLPHERIFEDQRTGDNQMRVTSLPEGYAPMSLRASRGDIIVFSRYTIHQSSSSVTSSRRLALIGEVEEYESRKLDDYRKPPLSAKGHYPALDYYLMSLKAMLSPYVLWRALKKNPRIARVARKLRYGIGE